MRIKEGFRVRKLLDEYIVTAEGLENLGFNKMFSMNESAAFLWQEVSGKDFSEDSLADLLCEHYGIDRQRALADAAAIAGSLIEAGLAEK